MRSTKPHWCGRLLGRRIGIRLSPLLFALASFPGCATSVRLERVLPVQPAAALSCVPSSAVPRLSVQDNAQLLLDWSTAKAMLRNLEDFYYLPELSK